MGGPLVTRPAAPDVPAGDRHVRQAALTVASRIAQLALGGVASIVIARALQPDGRGAFAIAVTAATTTLALGHLAIELSHTWLWSEPANRRAVDSRCWSVLTDRWRLLAMVLNERATSAIS